MVWGPRITRSTKGSRPGAFFSRAIRLSTDSPKAVGTGLLMFCWQVRIWQSALLWLSPLLRNGSLIPLRISRRAACSASSPVERFAARSATMPSRVRAPGFRGQNWSGSRLL